MAINQLQQKNASIIFIVILFLIYPLYSQTNIAKIYFIGIDKTEENYLRIFIKSTENTDYDSLQVERDIQSLHNLRLFSDVTVKITASEKGKIVEFHCPELFTLLPIISFGGVSDNFWYQVGAMDYNLFGRGYTLGGYYRYYDRHSFAIFLKAPHLFDKHWGATVDFNKFSTLEPAHFSGGAVDYRVDRWNFTANIIYNFSIYNSFEFGGGYLLERYSKNDFQQDISNLLPTFREFDKYLLKLMVRNDYINYYYQYITGFANDLNLESVTTGGYNDFFWKMLNISKIFFRPFVRGNFGIRLRLGVSTNKNSPFVPFVLDNYINVRGSGNRVSRGTAEITINSEYRHTFWEHGLGAVQGVVFMDMSAWRPAAGHFSEMFEDKNNVTFGGLGVRFYFRKFYNFIIRVDYGVSITGNKGRGMVFGAGQYF